MPRTEDESLYATSFYTDSSPRMCSATGHGIELRCTQTRLGGEASASLAMLQRNRWKSATLVSYARRDVHSSTQKK